MSLFGVIRDAITGNPMTVGSKGEAHVLIEDNVEQLVGGLITRSVTGIPQTLSTNAVIGDYTVTMTGGHGLVANDFIVIAEDDRLYQGLILSVATNVLTLDTPIDYAFPSSGTVVFEVVNDISTSDGSSTRVTYTIGTPDTVLKNVHYRGIRINISGSGSMDDGKFGDQTALTRGLVIRLVRDDGTAYNYVNAKTNGDLGLAFDNKVYSSGKGGGATNSVEFTWEAFDDNGSSIEIRAGDQIEVIVQDDLTGLGSMKIQAFGHIED